MSNDIVTQPTPTREERIASQHDALDMLMFLRQNDPTFAAETLRNRARRPRCVNHSDRPMSVYEAGAPLCADCYVALVEARMREATDAVV